MPPHGQSDQSNIFKKSQKKSKIVKNRPKKFENIKNYQNMLKTMLKRYRHFSQKMAKIWR